MLAKIGMETQTLYSGKDVSRHAEVWQVKLAGLLRRPGVCLMDEGKDIYHEPSSGC